MPDQFHTAAESNRNLYTIHIDYQSRGNLSYPFLSPPDNIDSSPFEARTISSKLHIKSAKSFANSTGHLKELTKTETCYTPSHQYTLAAYTPPPHAQS